MDEKRKRDELLQKEAKDRERLAEMEKQKQEKREELKRKQEEKMRRIQEEKQRQKEEQEAKAREIETKAREAERKRQEEQKARLKAAQQHQQLAASSSVMGSAQKKNNTYSVTGHLHSKPTALTSTASGLDSMAKSGAMSSSTATAVINTEEFTAFKEFKKSLLFNQQNKQQQQYAKPYKQQFLFDENDHPSCGGKNLETTYVLGNGSSPKSKTVLEALKVNQNNATFTNYAVI